MKIYILHILFFLTPFLGISQGASFSDLIIKNEKALSIKFKALRNAKTNADLLEKNKIFTAGLKVILNGGEAFKYPFDSLQSMSKLTSPDKAFRLFNWNVVMEDGSQRMFCLILKKNGTIIELKDKHRTTYSAEHKSLTGKNWYGAVYYEIIPLKKKGQYTLLGWNGKDMITTQKIIEVLILGKKKAKFGGTIFKYENSRTKKRRVIMEFASDAFVSLKYYSTKKEEQIIFSHLSPSTPQMEGHFQFYYPDLSYDRFVLINDKWVYESSADARNNKSTMDKEYNNPYDSDNPVEGGRR
jgi:hypothetical protein